MNSAVGIYKLIILYPNARARYYIELCHHESSNI